LWGKWVVEEKKRLEEEYKAKMQKRKSKSAYKPRRNKPVFYFLCLFHIYRYNSATAQVDSSNTGPAREPRGQTY
jgi:hypothetical protein